MSVRVLLFCATKILDQFQLITATPPRSEDVVTVVNCGSLSQVEHKLDIGKILYILCNCLKIKKKISVGGTIVFEHFPSITRGYP